MPSVFKSYLGGRKKAFVYDIKPQNSLGHSTAPGWMLSLVRFIKRSKHERGDVFATYTPPLIVINDCISVTVSNTKEGMTPGFSATLKSTNEPFAASVAPGDFVFVNMVNSQAKIKELKQRVTAVKQINREGDGFKGVFRIDTVNRTLQVDPMGIKTYTYQLTGHAFSEFGHKMYFNPYVYNDSKENENIFHARFDQLRQIMGAKRVNNIQDIVRIFISLLLGGGPTDIGEKVQTTPNTHFYIPRDVPKLLGLPGRRSYVHEIYHYLFGIQKYTNNRLSSAPALRKGLSPNTRRLNSNTYLCTQPIQGQSVILPEHWNQVEVWSILQQYCNLNVNELFTTFRLTPYGNVLPMLVLRQIPFTSEHYKPHIRLKDVTRFLSLPRWRVHPELIFNYTLGRSNASRVNYVQVFSKLPGRMNTNHDIAAQTGFGNYVQDQPDILRNGLHPLVRTAPFDYPEDGKTTALGESYLGPAWAELLGDFYIDGQLKESGTFTVLGIQEPISIGDNFQFEDMVYHIEGITHQCTIDPMGFKQFRTIINLSMGVDERSSTQRPLYGQMGQDIGGNGGDRYDAYRDRERDWRRGSGTLPGIGEAQDIDVKNDARDQGVDLVNNDGTPNPNRTGY